MADSIASLTIKIDSREVDKAIKQLSDLEKQAKLTEKAVNFKPNKKASDQLINSTKKASDRFKELNDKIKDTRVTLDEIDKKTKDTTKSTDSFTTSLKNVGKAAAAFVVGKLAGELAGLSDLGINIDNKIRQVTRGTAELNAAFDEVAAISARSRTGIESTAELFQKLSLSTSELGLTQKDVLRVTETINKSFTLSGATAAEADGAIRQLGQGLASGALRGDEFNSVAEQAPLIMRAIAKETGLSIGELREFAATGGITAEIVVNALQKMEGETDKAFSQTKATSDQAITAIRNDFVQWARDNETLTRTIDAVTGAISLGGSAIRVMVDLVTGVIDPILRFTEVTARATAALVEFGEFKLGRLLGDEFVTLRIGALSFVGAIEKGWAKIELLTSKLGAALEAIWDNALAKIKNNIGDFLAKVARALDSIPWMDGAAKSVNRYATELKNAGADVLSYQEKIAKLEAGYKAKTDAIDENIDGLVAEALATLSATEAGEKKNKTDAKATDVVKKKTTATKEEVKEANKSVDAFNKVTGALKNKTNMLGMSEQAIMLHNALAEAQTNIFTVQGKEIERLVSKYWETKEAQEKVTESTDVFDSALQELVNNLPPASAGLQKMGLDFDSLIEKGGGFKNILKDVTSALGEFTKGDFSKITGVFGEGGFSLSSIPSSVIQSGGAALATNLVESFVSNISSGKYNDALDDALPFLQLGRGLSALGINIGGKPSDKTQSAQIGLASGAVTQGGFLSGSKFSEENRTAADVSAAILSQVSQRLGDLSGNLEFIVGSRDGIRVSFDGEELFKSNDITATLTAATEFLFDMAGQTKEVYANLARDGESLGEAFLRLDTQFKAVSAIAADLGLNFSTVEAQAIAAADGLVMAAGGLDSFIEKSTFFFNKFFTEEEKFNLLVGDLNSTFEALGISVPRTREEFKLLVQGIDTNTEAGQKLYNQLLDVAPQVDSFIIGLDGWKSKITDVYENVLGREPDTAGLEYYLGLIESGEMTIEGVNAALENSTEAWVRNANAVEFTTDATEGLVQSSNKASGALDDETMERFRNATAIEETTEALSRSTVIADRIAQRTQQQMSQFQSSLQDPVTGGGSIDQTPKVDRYANRTRESLNMEFNLLRGFGRAIPSALQAALDNLPPLATPTLTTKIKPVIEEAAEVVAEEIAEVVAEEIAEVIDLRPLTVKLLEEQGKAAEALALTRQLEIESVTEAEAVILRQIYAQQDLNKLNAEAADMAAREKEKRERDLAQQEANKTRLDAMLRDYGVNFMKLAMEPLEIALFDLQQETLQAVAAAEALGATEDQLSVIRRFEERQRQVLIDEAQAIADSEAAEALAEVNQQLKDIAATAYDRLQASVAVEQENIKARFDAENDRLKTQFDSDVVNINNRYDAILGGLNSQLDGVNDRVGKLRSIAGELASAVDAVSPGVTLASRSAAQNRLTDILARVRGGADISQFDLSSDINQLTAPSEQLFSKFSDFALAQARARVTLGGLEGEASKQLTDAERQIQLLEQQIEQAEEQHQLELERREEQFIVDQERNQVWFESEINRLDLILENATAQLDALNGIDNSILSLQGALGGFAASMQAAAQAAVASQQSAGVQSSADLIAASRGGRIVNNRFVPGFANGTDYTPPGNYIVGEQGPEMLSIPGAKVTPNDALNMDDVKAEIKRGNYEMIKYLKRVWEIADKQDQIGAPVYTVTAP